MDVLQIPKKNFLKSCKSGKSVSKMFSEGCRIFGVRGGGGGQKFLQRLTCQKKKSASYV